MIQVLSTLLSEAWDSAEERHLCAAGYFVCAYASSFSTVQLPHSRISTIDIGSGWAGDSRNLYLDQVDDKADVSFCFLFLASVTGWQKLCSLLHFNFSKHSILICLYSHFRSKESLSCRVTQFGNTVPGIHGCLQVRLSCICCHIRPKAKGFVQYTRTSSSERLAQVLSVPALRTSEVMESWPRKSLLVSPTEVADQGCPPVGSTFSHL